MVKGFTPTPFPKTGNKANMSTLTTFTSTFSQEKETKKDKHWKEVKQSMFTVHIKKISRNVDKTRSTFGCR